MQTSHHSLGFTGSRRHIVDEDEIKLTSVGVDIGSSTSHLIFSRLDLKQEGARYVVVSRTILFESDIQLTPYSDEFTIDTEALGNFINQQYAKADLSRQEVDTGALILTGVAVRRRNARAIGELFAEEAGRFVAVTAGDGLETTMSAYGSGAVARSASTGGVVLNIDIGGGTSKIAICEKGVVRDVTTLDIGARLVVFDPNGSVMRIEDAGRRHSADAGVELALGRRVETDGIKQIARIMADRLIDAVSLGEPEPEIRPFLRLPPLSYRGKIDAVSFSGGVSEFVYGHEHGTFGDLGELLAEEVRRRVEKMGIPIVESSAGIRATVIGASQYTVQVSGSTIFISPEDSVPVRNVPVVMPEFPLEREEIDHAGVGDALEKALRWLDLSDSNQPVAIGFHWKGSATFARLHAFCSGIRAGANNILKQGHPLILVNDGDVGGLLGLHFKEELKLEEPVVSVDGIELQTFDYIDIGTLIPSSGAVPVVVKSLVFPSTGP